MAACDQDNPTQGYQCEFVESVPEDFFCKKCKLVARNLTFSSCCGETFCLRCIDGFLQEGKPCPVCGGKNFTTQQQVKYQKMVRNLLVYCSLKERGCDWKGPLEKFDAHLDPEQDDCQYVDTKCPLNCQQTIPKNKVEQHMVEECAKRDFVCKHCNFKGTYEEVTYKHLPECKYVPLQCPNLCGVTYDREIMEDHMKICRLEEVACDFKDLGCDERVPREEQDEHLREYSHKHLMLAASLALKNKEDFTKEIQEQREKHEAEEQELKRTLEEQELKLQAQEKKVEEQKNEYETLKRTLQDQSEVQEKNKHKFDGEIQEQRKKCRAEEQKLKRTLEKQVQAQEIKIEEQKKEYETLKCKLQDQSEVQEKNKHKFDGEIQEQRKKCRAEEQKLKRTLEKQVQAQEIKIEEQKKEYETLKRKLQDQSEVQEKNTHKFDGEIQEQRKKCRQVQAQEIKIEEQKKEYETLKSTLQDQSEVQEKNKHKFDGEIQEQKKKCRAEEQKLKRTLEQQASLQAQLHEQKQNLEEEYRKLHEKLDEYLRFGKQVLFICGVIVLIWLLFFTYLVITNGQQLQQKNKDLSSLGKKLQKDLSSLGQKLEKDLSSLGQKLKKEQMLRSGYCSSVKKMNHTWCSPIMCCIFVVYYLLCY